LKYAIYVSKNGERIGPFTKKELREAVHSGSVSWDDLAWHEELSEWKPVHSVIPIIHVARCGEEIGTFENERDILFGLRDGTLLMDDYYWCEGMSEWKPLSALEISKAALATAAQKDALKRARLPFDELTTKVQVSALLSEDGPATEDQKTYLKSFGITAQDGLKKREASDLIDSTKADSAALERQQKLRQAMYEEQRKIQAEYPSYHLKEMIASAIKDLEEAKKEKREAKTLLNKRNKELADAQQTRASTTDEFERTQLDNEIRDLENEASRAEEAFDNISVEEATDELRYEGGLRIKFWKATLPSGDRSFTAEDWEGLADYGEAIERYGRFARQFKVPSNKKISDILAKLDRDAPDWDKTEPERFYSTFAAFFPDLCREKRVRRQVPRSSVGCLVVLSGCLLLYYLLAHFS
jgi:hypothetical protein